MDWRRVATMSLIIVEPLSSGAALVEAAQRMGKAALVLTADEGERRLSEADRKWATSVIVVDTYDAEAVFHTAQEVVSRDGHVEAIVPGWEYCLDVVAKWASRLGFPHMSASAAKAARNKFASRERLKAAGLNVPRYALIHSDADVEWAACEVGFPAVVKPADGGGSILVRRVDSLDELRRF